VNGSFAEYAMGAAAYVGRLPRTLDFVRLAPILCAGVTTYKGIKETEARPGEWIAKSGIGGLGHIAIQYAKAMGLHVVALDVAAAAWLVYIRRVVDVSGKPAAGCTRHVLPASH
jgi:propanol-preferring alcohol dehydrogenase